MRRSWDEIRRQAKAFAEDWKDAHYEKGETQSFYNDFFDIFGVKRRAVAVYEKRVDSIDANRRGFIDLFWPGTLIVEQKSAGRDLFKAGLQALDYFDWLPERDQPRYILTCDFQRWRLDDLETRQHWTFTLPELPKHVELFAFILGRRRSFATQAAVNIKAAELLGRLHDALEAGGYRGHDLERLLVRLLFCLFADDTGIFEPKDIFLQLIEDTSEDGGSIGRVLNELFDVLDTPEPDRQGGLSPELKAFPYVNGELFAGHVRTPVFDAAKREMLLDCARFDWGKVSPAIFGSLFQSVMEPGERRKKGAHYTSETNIMKVIGPLFIDELRDEFVKLKDRRTGRSAALGEFQNKLARLRFLDPACGCGNFLVIAYRELRKLELEALQALYGDQHIEAALLSRVTVDQFYGIEFEAFPAEIAKVAMWMADHIANNELSLAFNRSYARIPLKDSAHIRRADALEVDWNDVLPAVRCSYVLGNPPFVGHQWRTPIQQAGMHRVWGTSGQVNRLDYVTAWFKKAAEYSQPHKRLRIAFVATNSICQGEQAGILWPHLIRLGVRINFAHRTFVWTNEARGAAAVHCVIVGLVHGEPDRATIYDYPNRRGDSFTVDVERINGYLIDGPFVTLPARTSAPGGLPRMIKGSQPTDGARLKKPGGGYVTTSNLILDATDRAHAVERDPNVSKWLRPYVGGDELISGDWRWCLWLKDAIPGELRASAEIKDRLERVRLGRLKSPTASVKKFASFPTLFTQDRQPKITYIALPEVSSESRDYIPMSFLTPDVIASNKLQIVAGGSLFLFGILTSWMHMAWMRTVTGRLKSDYSYAPTVYNTFPWPEASRNGVSKDLGYEGSTLRPCSLARLEQIPQAAMLGQQLLRAKAHRPFEGGGVGDGHRHGARLFLVGQGACLRLDPDAASGGVEHLTDRAPVQRQRKRRAQGAPATVGLGEHFQGVTLLQHGRFAFGLARRARQRTGCDGQTREQRTLGGERLGGGGEPADGGRMAGLARGMVDDARKSPVQHAQIMGGVGEIADCVASRRQSFGVRVAMAGAAFRVHQRYQKVRYLLAMCRFDRLVHSTIPGCSARSAKRRSGFGKACIHCS